MRCRRRQENWTGMKPRSVSSTADLSKSGTQISAREDFRTLVTDVTMGQVGAVLALKTFAYRARISIGIDCGSCAPLATLWSLTWTVAKTPPIFMNDSC